MWKSSLFLLRQLNIGCRYFRARRAVSSPAQDNTSVKRTIGKSAAFTFGTATVCYTGATLWLYESNKRAKQTSLSVFHTEPPRWYEHYALGKWWREQTPGKKLFCAIVGINGIVVAMWKVPRLSSTMYKYFAHSPTSNMVSPMLLSVFSHSSTLHCACNMVVLYSFIERAVEMMGVHQFLATYLTGGVVSSFVSHVGKLYMKNPVSSLGASGALLTVIAYICLAFPDSQMQIIFLPMFTFKAITGLKGLVAIDTIGFLKKWSYVDHGAHLGGALYGAAYYLGENKIYFWFSKKLVKLWDGVRSGKDN